MSKLGKNITVCGNTNRIEVKMRNAIKYGIDAFIKCTVSHFKIPQTVYIQIPTGGVFAPNSVNVMNIIPK